MQNAGAAGAAPPGAGWSETQSTEARGLWAGGQFCECDCGYAGTDCEVPLGITTIGPRDGARLGTTVGASTIYGSPAAVFALVVGPTAGRLTVSACSSPNASVPLSAQLLLLSRCPSGAATLQDLGILAESNPVDGPAAGRLRRLAIAAVAADGDARGGVDAVDGVVGDGGSVVTEDVDSAMEPRRLTGSTACVSFSVDVHIPGVYYVVVAARVGSARPFELTWEFGAQPTPPPDGVQEPPSSATAGRHTTAVAAVALLGAASVAAAALR
jgi:hypothetical protein